MSLLHNGGQGGSHSSCHTDHPALGILVPSRDGVWRDVATRGRQSLTLLGAKALRPPGEAQAWEWKAELESELNLGGAAQIPGSMPRRGPYPPLSSFHLVATLPSPDKHMNTFIE